MLKEQVNYLSFIKDGTVTPSDEKINMVKLFPIPMNQAAVQSFLNLTSYFKIK